MSTTTRPPAITRQTPAGLLQVAWSTDACWCVASLDGKEIMAAAGYGRLQKPVVAGGETYRHYVGGNGKPAVGLLAEEVRLLDADRDAARVAWRTTAEGLRHKRSDLLEDLAVARQLDAETRDRAWEREDEAGAMVEDKGGAVARAAKALADFDAAHPDVASPADGQAAAEMIDQINYRGE